MPIYQYICPKCNLRFELKQSFSAEAVASCPKCQNGARRLFAPVPIIFKGSGFYVTDNRKESADDKNKDNSEQENKDTKE